MLNENGKKYLREKLFIMIRIKSQKCFFTSRILELSLSVSFSKYNRAPSMYSTNVGCSDIVSLSITHELIYIERKRIGNIFYF